MGAIRLYVAPSLTTTAPALCSFIFLVFGLMIQFLSPVPQMMSTPLPLEASLLFPIIRIETLLVCSSARVHWKDEMSPPLPEPHRV